MLPMLTLEKCAAHGLRLQWQAVGLLMALFVPLISEAMYVGDSCMMKTTPGVCKLSTECPELEMDVRAGKVATNDIVSCGFTTRDEIICCPTKEQIVTENRKSQPSTATTSITTTSAPTTTAFWSHLLTTMPNVPEETTTTTTAKPDFWLHLLSSTTTSTTTLKPLIVNGRDIDPNSGFIDLSSLLSKNNNKGRQNAALTDSTNSNVFNNNPPNQQQQFVSVNERATGWQSQPMGIHRPSPDWNIQQARQFPQVPAQMGNFDRFSQNGRNGRHQWPSNDGQPIHRNTPNQSPSVLDNEQSPGNNRNSPQRNSQPNVNFGNNEWQRTPFAPHQVQRENDNFGRPPIKWQDNNDVFSQQNGWQHNTNNENSAMVRPSKDFEPVANRWPNSNNDNPITTINNNLIKSGLNIVEAKLDTLGNLPFFREPSKPRPTSTPRTPIMDPFAPFLFRPPPVVETSNNNPNNGWPQVRPNDFNHGKNWEGDKPIWNIDHSSTKKPSGDDVPTSTVMTPVTTRNTDRPAVRACQEIDAGLDPGLTQHILGGTPAEIGEFPHMAAIGYSSIGNENGPYDYRCGGTLISNKFVLTAAHCVNSRDSQPSVVLLGLINLDDAEERRAAEQVKVKRVHIHPDYSSSSTYHDVALLELEREIQFTNNIYPTCLYTELSDPPSTMPCYATGWGVVDVKTKKKSNILLKAKLDVVPVARCNSSYVEVGLNRKNADGITAQQLCAQDPGYTKDACQGDSGGPLNMVVDESLKKYRVVGVVSAGFSCGTTTPGLYARVAAYLDYIEGVVWPK